MTVLLIGNDTPLKSTTPLLLKNKELAKQKCKMFLFFSDTFVMFLFLAIVTIRTMKLMVKLFQNLLQKRILKMICRIRNTCKLQ